MMKSQFKGGTALIESLTCLLTWPAPSIEHSIYSMLVPVEEGHSEARDLKVLGGAKTPADLAPSDLLK